MEITVKHVISLTPALEALVEKLMQTTGIAMPGKDGTPDTSPDNSKKAAPPEESREEKAKEKTEPTKSFTIKASDLPKSETTPSGYPTPGTQEWLQWIMDERFVQLLGADYKTNPDKQGTRREIAACFKLIAAGIDEKASKPSDLKTQEDKEKFAVELAHVTLTGKENNHATYTPF